MLELFNTINNKSISIHDPLWTRSLAEFITKFGNTDEIIPSIGLENKHKLVAKLFHDVLTPIQNRQLLLTGLTIIKVLAREQQDHDIVCTLTHVAQLSKLLIIYNDLSRSEDKEIINQEIVHEILRCFVNMLYVCPDVREWLVEQAGAIAIITKCLSKPIEVEKIKNLKEGDIKKKLNEYVNYHEKMTELHLATRIHAYLSESAEICQKLDAYQQEKIPLLVVSALNEIFIVEDFDNPIVIPIISAGLKIIENYLNHLSTESLVEFYAFKLVENTLPSFLLSCLKIQIVPGLGYPLNHFVTRVLNKALDPFWLVWTSENGISIETPWNSAEDTQFDEKKKRKSSFEFVRDLALEEEERSKLLDAQDVNDEVLMLLMNNLAELFLYPQEYEDLLIPHLKCLNRKLIERSEKIRQTLRRWIIYDANFRSDVITKLKRQLKKHGDMIEVQEFVYDIAGYTEYVHLVGERDPRPVFDEIETILGPKHANQVIYRHQDQFDVSKLDKKSCFIQ